MASVHGGCSRPMLDGACSAHSRRRWSWPPCGGRRQAMDLGRPHRRLVRVRGIVLSERGVAIDQRTARSTRSSPTPSDYRPHAGDDLSTAAAPPRDRRLETTRRCCVSRRPRCSRAASAARLVMASPRGHRRRAAGRGGGLAVGGRARGPPVEESLGGHRRGVAAPIRRPHGRDVGGGTSEVAVISLGGIVVSQSLRVGGYDLDDAITNHIRLEHRMAIGSQSAEAIKLAIGCAYPLEEKLSTTIRGRDLLSGLPRELESDGPPAIDPPMNDILCRRSRDARETPPELRRLATTASSSPAEARSCAGSPIACTARRACVPHRRRPAELSG